VKYRSTLLTALLTTLFFASSAEAQDSLLRNSISVGVADLPNRRLSVTYTRKLKNGNAIFFNPRVRIPKKNPELGGGIFNSGDPGYYYFKYHGRVGMSFPLGERFYVEPQSDFGYGEYYNKLVSTGGVNATNYQMDRQYYSAGLIYMMSWIKDWDKFRLKWYGGVGYHVRHIHERRLGVQDDDGVIQYYSEPMSDNYFKRVITAHLGLDIGFNW